MLIPANLSRDELYRQVWAEPIVHVAARLGLSDRGLAKLCARHRIPVPPRGWWAKKRHGHRVRQQPLTPVDNPRLERIVFQASDRALESAHPPEYLREKSPEWRIEVPDELPITHPLVKRAATAIRQSSRDHAKEKFVPWRDRYKRKLLSPGPGHLDIGVSKPLLSRALRIMQALLIAFDKRGYAASVTDTDGTMVCILDEPFQIALSERFRQVVVKRSYGNSLDLEPSGILTLRIGANYSNAGVTDKPPRLIEAALNRLIARLVRLALQRKQQRRLEADRERRWREHDDERRLRQQGFDSEKLRRGVLRRFAARFARDQRLRAFVASVETRLHENQLTAETQEVVRRWLAWAGAYLDESDPIVSFFSQPWPSAALRDRSSRPWDWK